MEYEQFLETGDPAYDWERPDDEWRALTLNYTSGTTGNPKGVVYHHRGGFLNATGNAIAFGLDRSTRYLWTLPMFHCNGWTFTWAVPAVRSEEHTPELQSLMSPSYAVFCYKKK